MRFCYCYIPPKSSLIKQSTTTCALQTLNIWLYTPSQLICASAFFVRVLPQRPDSPCLTCLPAAHALPMFREARQRSTRKQLEKDRLDPRKSHKPEPPVSGPGKVLVNFIDARFLLVQTFGLHPRNPGSQSSMREVEFGHLIKVKQVK